MLQVNTILELMFPAVSETSDDGDVISIKNNKILENETVKDNDNDKTKIIDKIEMLNSLKDYENTIALKYQYLNSNANQSLIKSLGIDSCNIMYGPSWNSLMPRFAANLSESPLEPIKSTAKNTTEKIENSTIKNDVPAVQFDWNVSGLVNPLEAANTNTLLLDSEHLLVMANLNKINNLSNNNTATTNSCTNYNFSFFETTTTIITTMTTNTSNTPTNASTTISSTVTTRANSLINTNKTNYTNCNNTESMKSRFSSDNSFETQQFLEFQNYVTQNLEINKTKKCEDEIPQVNDSTMSEPFSILETNAKSINTGDIIKLATEATPLPSLLPTTTTAMGSTSSVAPPASVPALITATTSISSVATSSESATSSSTISSTNQLTPLNSIPIAIPNTLDCIPIHIKETHIFTPKMETIPISQEIITTSSNNSSNSNNNNSNSNSISNSSNKNNGNSITNSISNNNIKNNNLDDEFVKEYHDVEYKIDSVSFRTTPPPLPPLPTTDVNSIFDDVNDDEFDDFNDYKTGPIQSTSLNGFNDINSRIYDMNLVDDIMSIPTESSVLDKIDTVFNVNHVVNDDMLGNVVNGIDIDANSLSDQKMNDDDMIPAGNDDFSEFQMNEIIEPTALPPPLPPPPNVPKINSHIDNLHKIQSDLEVTTTDKNNFINNYSTTNSFFDTNTITPIPSLTIPKQPLQPTTVLQPTIPPNISVAVVESAVAPAAATPTAGNDDDDEWSDFMSSDTVNIPSITNALNHVIVISNNNKITTDADDWSDYV